MEREKGRGRGREKGREGETETQNKTNLFLRSMGSCSRSFPACFDESHLFLSFLLIINVCHENKNEEISTNVYKLNANCKTPTHEHRPVAKYVSFISFLFHTADIMTIRSMEISVGTVTNKLSNKKDEQNYDSVCERYSKSETFAIQHTNIKTDTFKWR